MVFPSINLLFWSVLTPHVSVIIESMLNQAWSPGYLSIFLSKHFPLWPVSGPLLDYPNLKANWSKFWCSMTSWTFWKETVRMKCAFGALFEPWSTFLSIQAGKKSCWWQIIQEASHWCLHKSSPHDDDDDPSKERKQNSPRVSISVPSEV